MEVMEAFEFNTSGRLCRRRLPCILTDSPGQTGRSKVLPSMKREMPAPVTLTLAVVAVGFVPSHKSLSFQFDK